MFPCPCSRLRIWSRETGSAVPSRVSLLISILRLNLVLTYEIPSEFRSAAASIYLFKTAIRHRVSPELLPTDGVHCQESAGTETVNLKVVPNKCCLGRSPWTNMRLSICDDDTYLHTINTNEDPVKCHEDFIFVFAAYYLA